MNTTLTLITKFLFIVSAAWISFSIFNYGMYFSLILIIAAVNTLLSYFLGDLLILSRLGNAATTISDGIFAALSAYIIIEINGLPATTQILIFALIVSIIEFFFHILLLKASILEQKDTNKRMSDSRDFDFSMETASELDPLVNIESNINETLINNISNNSMIDSDTNNISANKMNGSDIYNINDNMNDSYVNSSSDNNMIENNSNEKTEYKKIENIFNNGSKLNIRHL